MFEAQLAFYLNKYLGAYVYGVDAHSLKVSVFQGDVVLENLQLKPEALADLNLPVVVKSGLVGSLKLKVPFQTSRSPQPSRSLYTGKQTNCYCRSHGQALASLQFWWRWTGCTSWQAQKKPLSRALERVLRWEMP